MDRQTDKAIVDAVLQIRDRFGVYGLRDMIALAERELAAAEAALREFGSPEQAPPG
ncbi:MULTISPECIES: hypothetical protein [Thermomonospora]|uniref:Uncharacterized protein n=1 Tax=Thermomonospora cellulosilytica TaxID=1411118 RepID=A0A7W3R9F3_9ACTN|nr:MULTISPECIES: hypothetical protein [Thermomonospora]MBA9004726.1 hypothetical protein [Thermomonospora cellulosilytica]